MFLDKHLPWSKAIAIKSSAPNTKFDEVLKVGRSSIRSLTTHLVTKLQTVVLGSMKLSPPCLRLVYQSLHATFACINTNQVPHLCNQPSPHKRYMIKNHIGEVVIRSTNVFIEIAFVCSPHLSMGLRVPSIEFVNVLYNPPAIHVCNGLLGLLIT